VANDSIVPFSAEAVTAGRLELNWCIGLISKDEMGYANTHVSLSHWSQGGFPAPKELAWFHPDLFPMASV